MTKCIKIASCLLLFCAQAFAQIIEPVSWTYELNDDSELLLKATIDDGWHLYDQNLPEGGPISTSFHFETVKGAELVGSVKPQSKPIVKQDDIFQMELRWFEHAVTFVQKFKLTDPAAFEITGELTFMVCNDNTCLSPTTEDFSFNKNNLPEKLIASATSTAKKQDPPAETPVQQTPADTQQTVLPDTVADTAAAALTATTDGDTDWWAPVVDQLNAFGNTVVIKDNSWWKVLIAGFLGGLIALLTPCVWPMIPMTVGFFLKRSKTNRKKAISDALIYGFSIIVIYLALGLLVTILFGASALNDLSTNAVFNLLFFALLVLFAVSFFGAFELALPASWTTKLDSKADSTTGLISIFFMAFTLVLVSFSCTGPIIGTLLVETASQGSLMAPAIGMFGFALALAIPFALFAIFPSWLENMPKSGGWLNSVKVLLGFAELALALKFLSIADLAYGWHLLDREVFLVLWIVIFALAGMYLLGKLKFSHDSDLPHVSVPRLFLAIITLSFTLYMVPGLWGAPLKAISAFLPPIYTQDFNLYSGVVTPKYHDYESGMEFAKRTGKPVLVDFTGFGCVNCREMEVAVWSDPRVKQIIDNDYVLISLYVDDKAKLPQPIQVTESGKVRTLKTTGDKWSYLQRSKFGANAQPFYVLLDNAGNPMAPSHAYDKNIDKYIRFLKKGLEVYQK
ncbi:MAG: thioredoxin family protein [Dysgonamonadaceae bacterium]|jgi:thiol:disulfide interchange protein DsbD|nr:thioredoxin family protein [Dysgonamonadaceae bacterium]